MKENAFTVLSRILNSFSIMATISSITAQPILDSRSQWTVRTTLSLDDGVTVQAAMDSDTSAGVREAISLSGDKEKAEQAVKNITERMAPVVVGMDPSAQQTIDERMQTLDGTENLAKLGGNAILSVSIACAKAAALGIPTPLFRYLHQIGGFSTDTFVMPVPICNLIEGGAHADFWLDFQEFHAIPSGLSLREGYDAIDAIVAKLGTMLEKQQPEFRLGEEGGFAVKLASNRDGLALLTTAITAAGFTPGHEIKLGIDADA